MTELTPELAKLCGAHAADGSLYLQRGRGVITARWEIGDEEEANIVAVQEWVERLFGVKLKMQRKSALHYLRTSLQVIPRYLIRIFDFPVGEKSHVVREPQILRDAKDDRILVEVSDKKRWELRLDFAKEVINFDGYSTMTGGIISVGLGSRSRGLRRSLIEIFQYFGIKFSNYDEYDKMLTTSWEESKKLYELGLFRGQKREKFRSLLGR